MKKKMNKDDMKHRTRQFAIRIIRLVESLPKGRTENVFCKQLLRSGTLVGQIIGLHVERNLPLILFTRWELLRKKRTNPFTGWNS